MQPKKILIAEDEAYMRGTLELIVERMGHIPLCVDNGKDALETILHHEISNTPIDLLLCDIQMPGMTGTELISTLRKRNSAITTIVITGYGEKDLIVQLMQLGCRDFIDKPFLPEQIEERIEVLVKDINSREADEKRLEFYARVGESARSFVHDINNAVVGVSCYADMLMQEVAIDHPLHSRVSKVAASAERTAEICRELLSLAPENIIGNRIPTDINLCIERCAEMLSDLLPENITIRTGAHKFPVWFNADSRQIQQALLNLGFNAADAMPKGGEISLHIARHNNFTLQGNSTHRLTKGKCLAISVTDNGIGIPPEAISRILDGGYSTKKTGYGIGLATVKKILEAHDGDLVIDSQPGKGTCFHLVFPLTEKKYKEESEEYCVDSVNNRAKTQGVDKS